MNTENVPDIIVGRLPVYLRALQRMSDQGIGTTSSQELGEDVGISAAQIRKDLSQFGEFGKQGTGYHIPFLIDRLRQILKVDRRWDVAVVGMGELGHAIVRYQGFANRGFHVQMCFDSESTKIGQKVGDITVHDAQNIVKDVKGARQWDRKMSVARKALDWRAQGKLALDPEKFRAVRKKSKLRNNQGCTMCGEFCAVKKLNELMK